MKFQELYRAHFKCMWLIIWPKRDSLQKMMPNYFQLSFGKKVTIITDCFEIFLEWPTNLKASLYTWSNYKHRNTAKVLLEIIPQGSVAFVSETWGGCVSDKHLTENCGTLKKLFPWDIIVVDRRFDIAESVGMMQARLHIPASTKGKDQLTAAEVEETRKCLHSCGKSNWNGVLYSTYHSDWFCHNQARWRDSKYWLHSPNLLCSN